ncbi:hypothetical protein KW423_11555 [Vibrio fluvialis]|nr:hypothetical protein [Vibrio fluvialis]
MKSAFIWLVKTVLVVTVLVTNSKGLSSDGLVNLILFWAWIEIALGICSSLLMFSDKEMTKLANKMKERKTAKWVGKSIRLMMSLVAVMFIYFGYWFTGIAFILLVVLLTIVAALLKEKVKGEQ